MAKTIKLSIRARGEGESPTVDDLLDQLRDYFELLEGVEEAIADDGRRAIEWRIVSATTNSPLSFEAVAFPIDFAVNVDQRAELVTRHAALGMQLLRNRGERPPYFTDAVLHRTERMFERLTNGLTEMKIDYGPDLPKMDITPGIARAAAANTRMVLTPPEKPYDELGSIEGYAKRIERDGFGRHILVVKHRLTGEDVKCLATGDAIKELETHRISDVWRGRRVQVYGTMHFKGLGILSQVEATQVRFLRDRSELPDYDQIVDENFTGGLRTEEYLARLRDGQLA
jgi:hypothetical protein